MSLGKCLRPQCKFYHLPTAPEVASHSSANILDVNYGEIPSAATVANLASPGLVPVIANGTLSTLAQTYPAAVVDGGGV